MRGEAQVGVYLRTHGDIQKASWRGRAWARAWVRDVCVRCPRTQPDDGVGRMDDVLEELLQHREPEALQQCLRKVRALEGRSLRRGDFTSPGADRRGQALGPRPRGPQCSHL